MNEQTPTPDVSADVRSVITDVSDVVAKLERLEYLLEALVAREAVREYYTTAQFAAAVGKAEWTIRRYCATGRLRAIKRQSGRGASKDWALGHDELLRYQKNGLLPAEHRP